MSDYVYEARFIDDDIRVEQFKIISKHNDSLVTVNDNGLLRTFPDSIFKVAFSREDAILALVNSYNSTIINVEDKIEFMKSEIIRLKAKIPEIMYEQRRVSNLAERYKKCIDR